MFRWEPEGRYRCTKSMTIPPFWFSTEHRWTSLTPFWLSIDDIKGQQKFYNHVPEVSAWTRWRCQPWLYTQPKAGRWSWQLAWRHQSGVPGWHGPAPRSWPSRRGSAWPQQPCGPPRWDPLTTGHLRCTARGWQSPRQMQTHVIRVMSYKS